MLYLNDLVVWLTLLLDLKQCTYERAEHREGVGYRIGKVNSVVSVLELVGERKTSTRILVAFPLQSTPLVSHIGTSSVPAGPCRFVEAVGPDDRQHPSLVQTVWLREV